MDWIREKLPSIGGFCFLTGIASSFSTLVGYELRIFRTLDEKGPLVAWGVRVGFIVAGVVLYLLGPKSDAEAAQHEEQ
jgi:hypothetical protein